MCVALVACSCAARADVRARDLAAADSLAGVPAGPERDRALARWAERASLPEILFVLRRPAATLGAAEGPLVEAALRRVAPGREALRRRLSLRWATAAPRRAERAWRELRAEAGRLPMRPRASVFRIAVILPDSGDYEAFGRAVRLGMEAGLAQHNARASLPVALAVVSSGDDSPEKVAAAVDRAAEVSAAIVGGVTDGPTVVLATAARLTGVPLLSPAAADERIGAIGGMVFQVGPSGWQRGRVLARAALSDGSRRVGILTAAEVAEGSFARGFAAAAESLGATIAWTGAYAPGNPDFRAELRALQANRIELLFWDGEARDAATFLRQAAQEKLALAVCGGSGLDPEHHHAAARPLLEGALFVGEDWSLSSGSRAVLDGTVASTGDDKGHPLHARGYLAARLIAAAVQGGALCPEELGAALATRVGADPHLRARGFLDWSPAEATLPVYAVRGGRAGTR